MNFNNSKILHKTRILLPLFILISFFSCDVVNDSLAPYAGSPDISGLQVESKSFTPKITWIGGYTTVLGVNRGSKVALDNSLIWLIYKAGDGIHYPVKYGELQNGVQDLTSQYGGATIPELIEDSTYTFWVLKENVWNILTSNPEKVISLDTLLTETYLIQNDTIKLAPSVYTKKTQQLDNYINIYEVSPFGRLGTISVEQPTTSDNPKIKWKIIQSGVTDTLISAIGIAEGSQYSSTSSVWEAYSEVDEGGTILYGKHNVIPSPLVIGQNLDNTKIFVEYPAEGLKRNQTYYIWIANKDWDGVNRLRATSYYAYATFKTR